MKPTPVTLAIGDGANDVPMLQEAQAGRRVGRSGGRTVGDGRCVEVSHGFSLFQ